jgi:hypothetical protein
MIRFAHYATVFVWFVLPTLASAATIAGGVSGSGGFFGFSWGSGGGPGFGCSATICGIAGTILYVINSILVPILFAVSFIVFLYGVAQRFIFNSDKASSDGSKFILWGIIGFVVMISVWGLVNIVANTFGLQGYYAPPLPTTYY